jgi:hypothetical protein
MPVVAGLPVRASPAAGHQGSRPGPRLPACVSESKVADLVCAADRAREVIAARPYLIESIDPRPAVAGIAGAGRAVNASISEAGNGHSWPRR